MVNIAQVYCTVDLAVLQSEYLLFSRVGKYVNQAEWTCAMLSIICGDLKTFKQIFFKAI